MPDIQPYKLGVMLDLPNSPGLSDMFVEGIRFALKEAYDSGIVDRPVELLERSYHAQPWADGSGNVEVYRELVEKEKVLGIAGPMSTDNCLAVLPEVERLGVPNITICGTQLYVGRAAFNLSNGGMGDEPAVIAAWLKGEGYKRVAVIKDVPSQIGEEYCHYFRYACQNEGMSIILEQGVSPLAVKSEMTSALITLKSVNPDALVYLGLAAVGRTANPILKELDWDPPRIMCTAFVGASYSTDYAHQLEGWHGIDQYDERNTILSGMLERCEAQTGKRLLSNSATSCGYDIGRAYGLAMGRMRIATPAGLRDALETIRRLPAATGAPGTVITFGPQDHRGFKGSDYLLLRRAAGGTTHFVATAPVE